MLELALRREENAEKFLIPPTHPYLVDIPSQMAYAVGVKSVALHDLEGSGYFRLIMD